MQILAGAAAITTPGSLERPHAPHLRLTRLKPLAGSRMLVGHANRLRDLCWRLGSPWPWPSGRVRLCDGLLVSACSWPDRLLRQ
jgi:hypothetical protein